MKGLVNPTAHTIGDIYGDTLRPKNLKSKKSGEKDTPTTRGDPGPPRNLKSEAEKKNPETSKSKKHITRPPDGVYENPDTSDVHIFHCRKGGNVYKTVNNTPYPTCGETPISDNKIPPATGGGESDDCDTCELGALRREEETLNVEETKNVEDNSKDVNHNANHTPLHEVFVAVKDPPKSYPKEVVKTLLSNIHP